ncbi:MAG: hypothetical protein WCC04_13640, partial [Terriglobales bacterium]
PSERPGGDTSWKDRLRFPAQKKKDKKEAGTEPADATENFHDFRGGKAKTAESSTVAKPAHAGRESAPAPDIPPGITADELDALSAAAANLDTATPAETIAPAVETSGPAQEIASREVVNTALFAQESAPIDRADEPIFAVLPAADESLEAKAVETTASSAAAEQVEARAGQSGVEESRTDESRAEEPRVEESKVELAEAETARIAATQIEATGTESVTTEPTTTGEPAAYPAFEPTNSVEPVVPAPTEVTLRETAEAEGPPPSEEELAQALRLLTPATGSADPAVPSRENLVAAGLVLAQEAARAASSWIAEPVPLSPEEESISLEAEMFGTFAAGFAGEVASPPVANQVPTSAEPIESPTAELASPGQGSMAESVPPAVSESIAESVPESTVEAILEPAATDTVEANEQNLPATLADESAQEQAPAATFADAMSPHKIEIASVAQAIDTDAPSAEAATPAEFAHRESSPDAGGQPDMGNRGTQRSGKSGGRKNGQPAAEEPLVEAIESQPGLEAPKTMAAAAAANGASTTAPDASAIASIVESVLADLRPKIVEEITRKLSGK